MGLPDIVGPDGGSQAVDVLVSQLGHLVEVVEGQSRQHRTEDLFLGDLHVVFHAAEDSGFDKVAVIAVDRSAFAAGQQRSAFVLAGLNVA